MREVFLGRILTPALSRVEREYYRPMAAQRWNEANSDI